MVRANIGVKLTNEALYKERVKEILGRLHPLVGEKKGEEKEHRLRALQI